MLKIRVVTLNLFCDDWRRWERLDLAVAEIKRLKPDILLLQEVHFGAGAHKKLAKMLPGYHMSICHRGGNMNWVGQAIFSKLRPLGNDTLALSQNRVAQKVTLKIGSQKINFINVHLYFSPYLDKARRQQVHQVLDFARAPAVVAGDFNAMPAYGSIKVMKTRFSSAHQAVHGSEPRRTYPSPLWRGPAIWHSWRRRAINLFETVIRLLNQEWIGTIDYIFVEQGIKARNCYVVFDKPLFGDPKLYASDHFGLVADLEV